MYNSLRQLFYCNIQVHRSINCFLLSLARTSISFLPFLRGTSLNKQTFKLSGFILLHWQSFTINITSSTFEKTCTSTSGFHPIHITTPCDINHRFWIPIGPVKIISILFNLRSWVTSPLSLMPERSPSIRWAAPKSNIFHTKLPHI